MSSTEVLEMKAELSSCWRKPLAVKAEVCAKLLAALAIDPKQADSVRHGFALIKARLDVEGRLAYAFERKIEPGSLVRVGGLVGEVTRIRKDGRVQVKLENGKSVSSSAFNLTRIW